MIVVRTARSFIPAGAMSLIDVDAAAATVADDRGHRRVETVAAVATLPRVSHLAVTRLFGLAALNRLPAVAAGAR